MKRRQDQQSPDRYGCDITRTSWLLHRIRDAAAFARRSARRNDAATETLLWVEHQLRTLQPVCSAQQATSGNTCGAPAVAIAEIHAVDGCDQIGLTPHGDIVETFCQECLNTVHTAMVAYVGDKRDMASRYGSHPVCSTCGRPTRYLHSVFNVRAIQSEGAAS